MTARREEGGFRADESLLGRAQKESRGVARYTPPAALRISPRICAGGVPSDRQIGKSTDPRLSDPRSPRGGGSRSAPSSSPSARGSTVD